MISELLIMMVQGRHLENPPAFAVFLFRVFEITHLNHNRKIFHEENSAKNRDQQFFPDRDSKRGDDAAQCKLPGITHEYLCRIKHCTRKSNTRSDKRRDENYQLTGISVCTLCSGNSAKTVLPETYAKFPKPPMIAEVRLPVRQFHR